MCETTVKEVKIHNFLVCACKYQDFAQSQQNSVRSHNRENVTFRNTAINLLRCSDISSNNKTMKRVQNN